MSDDDMEDYGFEYSDEEVEEEHVDIENQYYNSKGTAFYSNFLLRANQSILEFSQVCLRAAIRQKPLKAFRKWSKWSQIRPNGSSLSLRTLSTPMHT